MVRQANGRGSLGGMTIDPGPAAKVMETRRGVVWERVRLSEGWRRGRGSPFSKEWRRQTGLVRNGIFERKIAREWWVKAQVFVKKMKKSDSVEGTFKDSTGTDIKLWKEDSAASMR
jgi:hypothetical protein